MVLSAGLAVLFLIALALCWRYAAPYTNRAVALAARPISPDVVAVEVETMELALHYRGQEPEGPRWTRVHGLLLQYGALLAIAVFLPTPGCSWRRRAASVGVAVVAYWALAAFAVALLAWALLWTVEGGPFTLMALVPIMPLLYIGVPAVTVGAWCWRHWLPLLSAPTQPRGRPRVLRSSR